MDSKHLPSHPTFQRSSQPAWQTSPVSVSADSAQSSADRQNFLAALDKAGQRRQQQADEGPPDVRAADTEDVPDSEPDRAEEAEGKRSDVPSARTSADDLSAFGQWGEACQPAPIECSGSNAVTGLAAAEGRSTADRTALHLSTPGSPMLAGSASPESLSAMLRHDASAPLAGQAMAFEVIDADHAINALQMTLGSAGWNLKLVVERGSRESLRRHAGVLETSLAESGQTVSRVQFVEGGLDD